jgi:hypothetical protein
MPVDMSASAITARIKLVAELHYLHLSLAQAKPLPKSQAANGVAKKTADYGTKHGPKASR